MRDKVVLITGASQGIGAEVSGYLSKQGAICVLTARSEDKLKKISEQLPQKSYVIAYDLMDIENIVELFKQCKEWGIKLDGMVHCAGIADASPIKVKNLELWNSSIRLNSLSFLELLRCFANKKYSNDHSSVVAMSSITSLKSDKGLAAYSASKAMLNSIIKTATKEFSPDRIRVNAIMPAYVDTGAIDKATGMYESFTENLASEQPMGVIPARYVSYLTEFLLGDKARYITGALIPMGAGKIV